MAEKVYTGACLCGNIKYKITLPGEAPTPEVVLCHCTHCKRYTGSTFSSNIIVPQTALAFTAGAPKLFLDGNDAGTKLRRQFCSDCGSPLTSEPTQNPDIIAIKAGTLDDREVFDKLASQIYCKRRDKVLDQLGDESLMRLDGMA